MDDDRWLIVALIFLLAVIGYLLLYRGSAITEERFVATTEPTSALSYGDAVAVSQRAVATPVIPLVDSIGTFDLGNVPRYPGAKAIDSGRESMIGLSMTKYVSADRPIQVAEFYMKHFNRQGYRIDQAEMLDADGAGWWANFTSPKGTVSVGIFAISRWIDLPPGHPENPTRITIIKVDGDDLDVEELLGVIDLDEKDR